VSIRAVPFVEEVSGAPRAAEPKENTISLTTTVTRPHPALRAHSLRRTPVDAGLIAAAHGIESRPAQGITSPTRNRFVGPHGRSLPDRRNGDDRIRRDTRRAVVTLHLSSAAMARTSIVRSCLLICVR
jgi:hypothetical protein